LCAVVIRCALHRISGGIVGEIAVAIRARNAREAIAGCWILISIAAAIACFTQAIAHGIVTITQIAVAAIGGNQTVQRIVAEALVVGVVEAGLKLSFYCLNWAPKLEVLPDRWWH
jgi:hypothetical protein